jgi:uncharacterized surface protein with fasciclin (FAS1) repeats
MANIYETLKDDGRFGRLLDIIETLGKGETLKGEGPITFFAPVDSAWDEIPEPNRSMILYDKQMLGHLFDFFQIRGGKYTVNELLDKQLIKTVEGTIIEIKKTEKGTQVDEAVVIESDKGVDNGIIHIVDSIPFTTLSQAYEAYAKTRE